MWNAETACIQIDLDMQHSAPNSFIIHVTHIPTWTRTLFYWHFNWWWIWIVRFWREFYKNKNHSKYSNSAAKLCGAIAVAACDDRMTRKSELRILIVTVRLSSPIATQPMEKFIAVHNDFPIWSKNRQSFHHEAALSLRFESFPCTAYRHIHTVNKIRYCWYCVGVFLFLFILNFLFFCKSASHFMSCSHITSLR